MSNKSSALYSPYGAFEQKRLYQRNFAMGTGLVTGLFVVIVGIFAIIGALQAEDDYSNIPVTTIKTIADLGPPPTIAKKPPQVKVEQVNVVAPKVGIPKPVADEEVIDDDVVIATRDELAEIVAPDPTAMSGGDGDILVDIDESEWLPEAGDFQAVEIPAEQISIVKPKYPPLLETAGIEGSVWVQVLVSKEGEVLRAQILKSSGVEGLDDAALESAWLVKYKPAIQNGRPVPTWVKYEVEFIL